MPENTTGKKKDVFVTRIFDAPLELVWSAWTDAKHVMRWWGPNYYTAPVCVMDFREGGKTLVCMRAPDGQDNYSTWSYQKIVPMERIEYIQNMSDKDGNPIDPVSLGLPPDFPEDVQTVITFKALGDKTEVKIYEYGFPDSQIYVFAEMGMNQCMDKMAAIFAGEKA